ncbi:MAG: DNA-processing protein DprA [Gemmatimonadetes bacterium]|nr:DNA-processing protein DprA [Gemmatimonadota bacterium]
MGTVESEATAWLALLAVDGVGPSTANRLAEHFGGVSRAIRSANTMSARDYCAGVPGGRKIRPEVVAAIARADIARARAVITGARARGIEVWVRGRESYPPGLLNLPDPPPVLFVRPPGAAGDRPSASFPTKRVAIVGTRAATAPGRRVAFEMGRDLGTLGWSVVSGMASGIDAAAHEGNLSSGGESAGVLGSGHQHQYPPGNARLYGEMRESGWLVSEFEPSEKPVKSSFPRRNRIIAALSEAVVVVEAGMRSGARITAEFALDLGRAVLAVPGRVHDRKSAGCLDLLGDGAILARGAHDVVAAVENQSGGGFRGWPRPELETEEDCPATGDRAVLAALRDGAMTVDQLSPALSWSLADVIAALGRLELQGAIQKDLRGAFDLAPPRLF